MTWLWHFLGFDYGLPYGHVGAYNVWSGFLGDVGIVGGIVTGLRLMVRQHRERLAQAARHQVELLKQSADHHKAHMDLLRRQHSQSLDAQAAPAKAGGR
jgi:hypothetical protein